MAESISQDILLLSWYKQNVSIWGQFARHPIPALGQMSPNNKTTLHLWHPLRQCYNNCTRLIKYTTSLKISYPFHNIIKRSNINFGVMTHSAKETRQQKEQRGCWTKFEKGGGGVSNSGALGTLCQLRELYMSGKTSLTCWKAKCAETTSLKNFY